MKKLLISGLCILIVFVGILVVGKNIIIKNAVQAITQKITGLSLRIQNMDVGFLKGSVAVRGMTLFNPPDYSDRVMMDLPLIYVHYDLASLGKDKIHLKEARLHLKEFVVVKNKDGQLNINALKTIQDSRQKPQKSGEASPQEKAKMPNIQIDLLELSIGKVIYKDYSQQTAPLVKEFNINLHERYSNITNPAALVHLIVVRALTNTTISRLANFDLNSLKDTLQNIPSGVISGALDVTKGTVGTIKKSAEDLMGIFKTPK